MHPLWMPPNIKPLLKGIRNPDSTWIDRQCSIWFNQTCKVVIFIALNISRSFYSRLKSGNNLFRNKYELNNYWLALSDVDTFSQLVLQVHVLCKYTGPETLIISDQNEVICERSLPKTEDQESKAWRQQWQKDSKFEQEAKIWSRLLWRKTFNC